MKYLKITAVIIAVFMTTVGYGQSDVVIPLGSAVEVEVPLEYPYKSGTQQSTRKVAIKLRVENLKVIHKPLKVFADGALGATWDELNITHWFSYTPPSGVWVGSEFVPFSAFMPNTTDYGFFRLKNAYFTWTQGNSRYNKLKVEERLSINPKSETPGYTYNIHNLKDIVGTATSREALDKVKGKGAIRGSFFTVGQLEWTPPYQLRTYLQKRDEKKSEETNAKRYNDYIRAATVNEAAIGRTDEALRNYEEAYKIKQDPAIKSKIEDLKAKQQAEGKKQEADKLKSQAYAAERTGDFEQAKRLYEQANTVYPNSDIQSSIARMEQKIKENKEHSTTSSAEEGLTLTTTGGSSSSGSSRNSGSTKSTSSSTRKNSSENNSHSNAPRRSTSTAVNLELAKQSIRELDRQAAARRRQVDKYRREQQAKAAEEYRAKRQREVEERERRSQRQFEDLQRSIQQRQNQGKEQRLATYRALGGDTNYKTKFNQWAAFASTEVKNINSYLNKYEGSAVPFQYPQTSCDYVRLIENIQQAAMPEAYKDVLIDNVLTVRNEFYRFDMENGYNAEGVGLNYDKLGREVNRLPCSNYLEAIAGYREFKKDIFFSKKYDQQKGFSSSFTMGTGTTYYEETYKIPYGALPFSPKLHFKDFVKDKGIHIQSIHLDRDYLWSSFHKRPYDWSNGLANMNAWELNKNLVGKLLWDKPTAIQSEADKHNLLYNIKRSYRLNTIDDEIRMAFFNYHTGQHQRAFNHLIRHITLRYGNVQGFANAVKSTNTIKYDKFEYDDKGRLEYGFPLLAATLLIEASWYEQSLIVLEALKVKNTKNKETYSNSHRAVNEAISKLTNQVYYRKGEYDKMKLPSEAQIKAEFKAINAMFDPIKPSKDNSPSERKTHQQLSKEHYINFRDYPIQAHALLKLGNSKLAKQLFANAHRYYQKQGVFKGTQTDIDAFKEVVKALKMSDTKIKYRSIQGYDIFNRILDTYEDGTNKDIFLATNDIVSHKPYYTEEFYYTKAGRQRSRSVLVYPKSQTEGTIPTVYINKTPVNLSDDAQWEAISAKLNNLDWSSRQAVTALYQQMKSLYAKGSPEANEDALLFLRSYIKTGVALGEFHDVIPAIAKRRTLFPQHGEILEERLALLMWPQSFDKSEWEKNPLKYFFKNTVKNKTEYKNVVRNYLSVWSYFKITSPLTPFLYEL